MSEETEAEETEAEETGAEEIDQKSQLLIDTRREKLDKRISELESLALSLEERAIYAEAEAQLRKRIRDARDRIRATQPPGILDSVSIGVPDWRALWRLWGRIPTPVKALGVLVTVVVVMLLIGKAMST